MAGKLYIRTFGCQMHEYDPQKMGDVLRLSHGLTRTDDSEQADVLLLNTCSIREKAQERVSSQLGVWKDWKHDRPDLVILGRAHDQFVSPTTADHRLRI